MNAFVSDDSGDGTSAARVAYRLPHPVGAHPDESLLGLLMRQAAVYRFHDPMRLLRRLEGPKTTLWAFCQENPGSDRGREAADLLGLGGATFRRMSMWSDVDTSLSVMGTPMWRELVRGTTRACCLTCLRESLHHRASWLVEPLPVCPVHGTWLHDRCHGPRCGKPLSWRGCALQRCGHGGCRHDIRDAPVRLADPASMGGIVAIGRLLHAGDAAATPIGMPTGEVVRMAFVLGQLACGFGRSTRPHAFVQRELGRMPEIMDAGWRALDDWPNGFHRLLEQVRARASERKGKDGLRKAFGSLSTRVYEWARQPWGSPMGLAFAEHASSLPDLATTSRTLRRYAPGEELRHRHVSLGEAQRLLGVAPVSMMAIARRRDMFVLEPRGGGTPALLRADLVRDLQRELDGFLMPEQARALVGVGHKVMGQLEAAGLVTRVPEAERVMESRPYRRADVELLVSSCLGAAKPMTRVRARELGLTPLTRATAAGRSASDICRALVDGRIGSAATVTDARGLARIRLRMTDLERVLPLGRETLSMVEAAAVLGTNYQHLHVWAERGFLRTTASSRSVERGLRVTREALAAFRRDYVSGSGLGEMFGQEESNWLSRHLKFQDVLPVSGRGIDGSKMTLFRRGDITPAIVAAVRRVRERPSGRVPEKRRGASGRVERAAAAIACRWGADLDRTHNRFTDRVTGRVVQVVSGRRPDMTGVFVFRTRSRSLSGLSEEADAWVALVPSDGDTFLLVPFGRVPWHGSPSGTSYVRLPFDRLGRPLEMMEWAVPL